MKKVTYGPVVTGGSGQNGWTGEIESTSSGGSSSEGQRRTLRGKNQLERSDA